MAIAKESLEQQTRFDPKAAEPRISERWLESGLHHPEAKGSPEENYSIAIPPPNVTGVLHMGHALNGTIQDTLIRYHRMLGQRTKWILGTDHAGIATQAQVEKQLNAEGTSRARLGRDKFVERVWEWREQYGSRIIEQYKRLGASCDYDDERFTLDERYSRAVVKVFTDLYNKGYIFRDNYIVNWDPGSRSAISDLEVEDREIEDTLYYIDYPLAGGSGSITIATVRPETMIGDTAIAVHPEDERYTRLIGETALLPLVGRRLRIIGDDYVERDFGTGALKITPAHDPNDFELAQRHGLDTIAVIGEDGCMTAQAGRFAGMTALSARDAIVAQLRSEGRISRTESFTHNVPFSHRSGERIEPLVSLQWFMRMDELAKPAIEVVRKGDVKFYPERWARVYLDWMENIRPWCISRQLWWGHRLPVWYRGKETYVGEEPPRGEGWEQDPDVLDTWFSSALWPFATLGWPEETPELKAFYPTNVLLTARDIIFLWVARMIMMGLEYPGKIPFEDVYVHSTILATDGRRMSKSLGTGVDPLELIDAHGADATRFGLLAMSSTQDVRFSREKIEQGQQLANKLWNASRLVLLRVDESAGVSLDSTSANGADGDAPHGVKTDASRGVDPTPTNIEDAWILSRLQAVKHDVSDAIDRYQFHTVALRLYDFIFNELCDWYLELIKPRLYADDNKAVSQVALHVLRETVALAHPVMPFVTEAIWEHIPGHDGLLMGSRFPQVDQQLVDLGAEEEIERAIRAVQELRAWRDHVGVRPSVTLPAQFSAEGYERTGASVMRLAKLQDAQDAQGAEDEQDAQELASVSIPGGSVTVFATADVDSNAEQERLVARRKLLKSEIARAQGKLSNKKFVERAPKAIVDEEREKLGKLEQELTDIS